MDLHEIVSQIKKYYSEFGHVPSIVKFQRFFQISKRQIQKHGWSNLVKMAGLIPNTQSQQKSVTIIKGRQAKVLIIDIETAPINAFVYGLFDQNLGLKQIKEDWFILSWACKFKDSDEIFYRDNREVILKARDSIKSKIFELYKSNLTPIEIINSLKDIVNESVLLANDSNLANGLSEIIKSADVIIGHNLDKFDLRAVNARLIKYQLSPMPEMQTIDTLKIARKFFKFTSNKLDYIAQYLGVGEKLTDRKFKDFELWREVMTGNMEAFDEMEKYNKQDVIITEKVFDKLKTFDHRINFQMFTQDHSCKCGSTEFTKDGIRYTKSGAFQRYKCASCGAYLRSKENMVQPEIRKNLMN